MRPDLASRLVALQSRLASKCHVKLEHDGLECRWFAAIVTDRNEFPHWVHYDATTPTAAIERLERFLSGTEPDHAGRPRPPSAFLRE